MESINLSPANQIHINKKCENNSVATPSINSIPKQIDENGDEKIKKGLIALGVLGAAAIAITCITKGKKPKNIKPANVDIGQNTIQNVSKKLSYIDFDEEGYAVVRNDGKKFTGIIEDTLKSGDGVKIEYINGVLQKSTKTSNGTEIIKEYSASGKIKKINGKAVDIKKVQNEVKEQQAKLRNLLVDDNLSAEEFQKQADEIKYKSKGQKAKIKETFDAKIESERLAKEEAERLAKEEAERLAKEEAERLAKEEAEKAAKKAADEKQAREINERIQTNRKISAQVDEIMAQDDIDEKIEKLLNTKIEISKGRYDATRIKTTIGEVLDKSILGEYTTPIGTLYHGTNKTSYGAIMENGFSLDACSICESGKGIYFGIKKTGAEQYSTGGLIKANYTGKKIANVAPGTLESLQYQNDVRDLFERIFGHKAMMGDSDLLNTEILNRIYTKKLSDLGYDALHSASIGAGCEYIVVLNPKAIEILK